ncbi:MAG: arsenate reductase (glutaredoxin) [Polyangiaceae bacterium]
MSNVTIWHNPKCSKSRASLALLQERGLQPTVVEYLATPPSAEDIAAVLRMLGVSARGLMRPDEPEYTALGLASVDDEPSLIRAMIEHPILIQRPVVIHAGKAIIGRPPEGILSIL